MDGGSTDTRKSVLDCIKYAAGTDIGLRREENQDSFAVILNPSFQFYIVADGMGGVKGGAVASKLAVGTVTESLEHSSRICDQDILAAVNQANQKIFEVGSADQSLVGMGTTLVGLAFAGELLYIANVGDSRAYRIRGRRISQLTEDHTLVRELLRSGAITHDQAENHPVSHMLTRSLGPTPGVEVDCFLCKDGPARGDIYLLCSDGLYNLVTSREICDICVTHTLDAAVRALIELANDRGGTDNITIITCFVGDQFPFGPEDFPDSEGAGDVDDTLELYIDQEVAEIRQDQGIDPVQDSGNGLDRNELEPHAHEGLMANGANPVIGGGVSFDNTASRVSYLGEEPEDDKVEESRTTSHQAKIKKARKLLPLAAATIFGVALLVVAFALGGRYASTGSLPVSQTIPDPISGSKEVSAPAMVSAQIAPIASDFDKLAMVAPEARLLLPPAYPEIGSASASSNEISPDHTYSGLSDDEVKNITRRRAELADYLTSVSKKIESFQRPVTGQSGDLLKNSAKERESLNSRLQEIRANLDVATRKLTVWYGRQKRLQSTDPVNLATEVSVSSEQVKEKKEIFERATWAYLQESETLRYNPTDKTQEAKVDNLAKQRKQRMNDLAAEVREAIDHEITESNRVISDLTLERDTIQRKLDVINKDVEYVQTLLGSDSRSKEALKNELLRQKKVAESELEELKQLLPDQNSTANQDAAVQ